VDKARDSPVCTNLGTRTSQEVEAVAVHHYARGLHVVDAYAEEVEVPELLLGPLLLWSHREKGLLCRRISIRGDPLFNDQLGRRGDGAGPGCNPTCDYQLG
jgi:hypothetical protein